ncbi:LysR family transcriptional regulator [Mycetocola reblochoni]|uniref:LysR family transcriptional regulator n=2 Tax=Mycetocola reblochoni TaxID=331618 RepID=A0A3L6ZPB5_9MICO|nr:LysR family transcriptional regulator [Mycetocola reblochoni]RLP69647.1 LysR family transcriptional regulator [Mycetocola reblochoni]SJN19401.1 putative LysR-family transcriptional regulator [Mycetocola reblochoni REB411]
MLDVRRLRLLRELSIRGTIAGVAQALAYSPSAVSQQLALLERESGATLLRRSGRNVLLTPEAERLVAHTTRILTVLEEAESELSSSDGATSGTVRIAAFQSALLTIVPTALAAMRRNHPDVRVEVVHREPGAALAETWAREVDLVIAEEYPAHSAPHHDGLIRDELTEDRIHLAVPEGAAIASVADAAELPWTMEPAGTASRHFAEQLCRRAGFEPDVRYVTADLHAQLGLIASGAAVGLLPGLIWSASTAPVARVPIDGENTRRLFTAHRRGSHGNQALAAVRAELGAAVRGEPELPPVG